jgi:hypothetical protein
MTIFIPCISGCISYVSILSVFKRQQKFSKVNGDFFWDIPFCNLLAKKPINCKIYSVYKRKHKLCIYTFCVKKAVKILEGKWRLFLGHYFLLINGKIYSVYKRKHKLCIYTFCVEKQQKFSKVNGDFFCDIIVCFFANKWQNFLCV